MSTHSALGVKHPDGKITGCYVHFDGASMGPRIKDFVSKNTTTGLITVIAKAQAQGGMRSFHTVDRDGKRATDFLDDNEPYVIDETNFYDDHMGTFAWYLVDYTTGVFERTDKY
tara:strand:+ start:144 stop:485 length:342 start_codon:yes stop_codon:yes gene_type:complete